MSKDKDKFKDKDKILQPGASFSEILEYSRDNLDAMVQMQSSMAILCKAKYDALTHVGFTSEQALDIIKARGIVP